MSGTLDIFQDGTWKEAVVISEATVTVNDKEETLVTYLEPVSNRVVTCLKSSLPYKDETEAQSVREALKVSTE